MKFTRAAILVKLLSVAGAACGSDQDLPERQQAVVEAGAEVMPLPLYETTHIFTNTDAGGRQDVVADNPTGAMSIEAVRSQLAEGAAKFQSGDFAIHGSAMPGLAELDGGSDEIDVELLETPTGAAITYTTQDPELVSATALNQPAHRKDAHEPDPVETQRP